MFLIKFNNNAYEIVVFSQFNLNKSYIEMLVIVKLGRSNMKWYPTLAKFIHDLWKPDQVEYKN